MSAEDSIKSHTHTHTHTLSLSLSLSLTHTPSSKEQNSNDNDFTPVRHIPPMKMIHSGIYKKNYTFAQLTTCTKNS